MSLADLLKLLVVFVAMPLTWIVAFVLAVLIREDPDNGALRGMVVLTVSVALIVTIFGFVFYQNDLPNPWLDVDATRILTRGSLLVLSTIPALYLLRTWTRRTKR